MTTDLAKRDDASDLQHMMSLAIQQGPDGVEALRQLVELKREEEDRQAARDFARAMMGFQSRLPTIAPNQRGAHGAPYANREQIMHVIQPLLEEYGLNITYDSEPSDRGLTVICIVSHVNGHSTRTRFEVPRESPGKRMNVTQAEGSASEYAMRYALKLALSLRTGDRDDDGDAAGRTEPVTEHQAAELRALWDDVMGPEHDAGAFFDVIHLRTGTKIDTWAAMPASAYEMAVQLIERKRA